MVYTSTIQDLENKLFSLHPKAKEIYTLINGLKAFSFDDVKQHNLFQSTTRLVYDKNAPVAKKIMFALSYINKPSKIGDIENVIKQYQPDFDNQFSTALRVLKEDNEIKQFNKSGSKRDVYYGLSSWFNDDNTLKEEFKEI